MSSEYVLHYKSNKQLVIDFSGYPAENDLAAFATFRISQDDNTFMFFLNSHKDYTDFLDTLANAVAREIENPCLPVHKKNHD